MVRVVGKEGALGGRGGGVNCSSGLDASLIYLSRLQSSMAKVYLY